MPTTSDVADLKRTEGFILSSTVRDRLESTIAALTYAAHLGRAFPQRGIAVALSGMLIHAAQRFSPVDTWLPGALVGNGKAAALTTWGSHSLPEWVAIADEEAEEDRRRQTQEKNFNAFLGLLPRLLEDHAGEYALIVHAELRKVDGDLEALIHHAYSKFPGAIALIQPIQKELPKSYVGGPRSGSGR